ncbi:uncharacterized protein BDZ99DRAFT_471161 [Mytilinidion resinicola]|uniref:Uncharacterized protein n=1 Tax=Mytilinidion resinicola TaxID=574789 RepID=A0A6A6Z3W7_9PEZI|nr:uncharacterized protein BDZ99DRAFT_471161 [Mytilinidion resinicola]KAF2815842.1 hypothetical protein BDZ99DRAFT_471161 [Mytilinidion resinicola]
MTDRSMETPTIDSAGAIRAYTGIPGSIREDFIVLKVDDGAGGQGTFIVPRALTEKINYIKDRYTIKRPNTIDMPAISPDAFHRVVQHVSTGTFDIAVPLSNWKSYPLKAARTQQANIRNPARNLWLDWNADKETFSLRLYGTESDISGDAFSLLVLGPLKAPYLTLNFNQLSVTITPGVSEVQITFWTQDDLLDFLLQLLALLKSTRCPVCDERIQAMKVEEYSTPKLRTFSTTLDISDDNNIDVRSERFRLKLLDREFEVYHAVYQTGITEMYTLLLKKVEDILRGGEEDLQVALAQRVQKQAFTPTNFKEYVASRMYNMFRDVSVEDDLDFKGDLQVALAEALRRAGRC